MMFKAIENFEGIYEVNELGEVRSVDRITKAKAGGTIKHTGKVLKPRMDKGGYTRVDLYKNGIGKTHKVHRLVAETFLPNPNSLPEVHHLNHIRNDNRVENLQWVAKAEQIDEHFRAAISKARGTKLHVVGNGVDKIFISGKAVERELGISQTYVSFVANGKYKQAKGYKINFVD